MRMTNEPIDFQKLIHDKDIDARIRASRDDVLHLVRADIKMLESKVDSNFDSLNSKIDALESKVDNNTKRLEDKIDNVVSMKKWIVGIFVTILLAVAAFAAPNIVSFFAV